MFGALAAHTCSWLIARLGTEIAACGHHPKAQADTPKKKNHHPSLGQSFAACRVDQLFISEIHTL